MTKKKSTRGKKNVTKTPKNNIDINDIDAMLEDMKKLALDKTEEEKETESIVAVQEETNGEEFVENLNNENLVNEEESFTKITETGNVEKEEEIENTEDLTCVDEIKESKDIEEEKEIKKEKPVQMKQRRTYQEMFGGSWRGYGYDEF